MDRPFLLNVVVWGAAYVRRLFDSTVPSLLSPGNLPALARRRECELAIVTTPVDAPAIEGHPLLARLREHAKVFVVPVDLGPPSDDKYARLSAGHRFVCWMGRERPAYGVFLVPEMLISDGSLLHLDAAVRRGVRAVVAPVPRVEEEEAPRPDSDGAIRVAPRSLVRLLIDHAHFETRMFTVGNDLFSDAPGFVVWPTPDRSAWVVRGLHLYPVLVDLGRADPAAVGLTLDAGDFVARAVPDRGRVEVVADSDSLAMCGLTPRDEHPIGYRASRPVPETVRHFMRGTPHVNALHRWYFRHPCVLHAGEPPPELGGVLEASARFADEALNEWEEA